MSKPKPKPEPKPKPKPKPKPCECAEQVDAELKPHGLALDRSLMMNFAAGKASLSPPSIRVHKINPKDRKVKVRELFCTYCPFCGVKILDD